MKREMENLNSFQFEKAKDRLSEYFRNKKKWKTDECGEFIYYKGKRNLSELEFALQLAIGDDMEIISTEYCRNAKGDVIGGSIVGRIFVDADFNGWNQGTEGANVFIRFTLCETAYYIGQAGILDRLMRNDGLELE